MYPKVTTKQAAIQKPLSNCRITDPVQKRIDEIVDTMLEQLDSSEITITFKPKYRDILSNIEISSLMRRYFRFLPLNNLKEIILIPEYGQNKNLHYHGIIRGKASSVSELKGFLNRRFGRTTITSIRNTENYKKYIFKEQEGPDCTEEYIWYNYELLSATAPA